MLRVFLILSVLMFNANADVFKCETADGVIYSSAPCKGVSSKKINLSVTVTNFAPAKVDQCKYLALQLKTVESDIKLSSSDYLEAKRSSLKTQLKQCEPTEKELVPGVEKATTRQE